MPVRRRLYSPTGKPNNESSARHSREIRQFETNVRRELQTLEEAAAAAQAAADAAGGIDAATILDRVGPLDIVSTASRTAAYSFEVDANTMSAESMLRLTLDGEFENSTGVSRAMTLDVVWAGSTVYSDQWASIASSAAIKPMAIEIHIWAATATAHYMNGRIRIISATAADTGYGAFQAGTSLQVDAEISSGSITGDIAAASTLEIGITHDASNANMRYSRRGGILELL